MFLKLLLHILILKGFFYSSQGAQLVCYNGTLDNYQEVSLRNAACLINSCINISRETIIYAFGYTGKRDGPATVTVTNAYLNDPTIIRNVILLDWESEASASALLGDNVSYALKAVPNAVSIGNQMGKVLLDLSTKGLDLLKVFLVGHSLGAQLWGYTGRAVKIGGKSIGTIGALDPAGPLYDQIVPLQPSVDRTCAVFVFIIHTDPGKYGTNHSTGTVDIWANYGNYLNGTNIQPGCPNGTLSRFSFNDTCSHNRSWMLLAEGINNLYTLIASKAADYYSWVAANGTSNDIIYIGDYINKTATGNFYLKTGSTPPYGEGEAGLFP